MADIIRQLVWFVVVASAAFFAVFVVLGNFASITAQSGGPIAIHDLLSPGIHRLNGILVLPLACDELSVSVDPTSSTGYLIAFTTWQDPSATCPQTPTPRAFETIAPAPSSDVTFVATLNGKALPITIIRDFSTSSTAL